MADWGKPRPKQTLVSFHPEPAEQFQSSCVETSAFSVFIQVWFVTCLNKDLQLFTERKHPETPVRSSEGKLLITALHPLENLRSCCGTGSAQHPSTFLLGPAALTQLTGHSSYYCHWVWKWDVGVLLQQPDPTVSVEMSNTPCCFWMSDTTYTSCFLTATTEINTQNVRSIFFRRNLIVIFQIQV